MEEIRAVAGAPVGDHKTKSRKRARDAENAERAVQPRKADFRQRAHCNPLSDFLLPAPVSPHHVDWSLHYREMYVEHNASQIKDSERIDQENCAPATTLSLSPAPEGHQDQQSLYLNTAEYPLSYDLEPVSATKNTETLRPSLLDVGCGFGGLTIALAKQFPEKLVLGMEIREQVTNYVGLRIKAFREKHSLRKAESCSSAETKKEENCAEEGENVVDHEVIVSRAKDEDEKQVDQAAKKVSEDCSDSHHFHNAAVLRTNAMKSFPNYFPKQSLEKIFFCFPDPHFKKKTHRRRIVNDSLLSVYAYSLKEKGRIYTITDVKDLHDWMYACLEQHPTFKEVDSSNRRAAETNHDLGFSSSSVSSKAVTSDNAKHGDGKKKMVDEEDMPRMKARQQMLDSHDDVCVKLIHEATEEGHKVQNLGRFGKEMYFSVFEKAAGTAEVEQ
ncbi:unnamed protein product [Amoebophrya sp. A120]|nr:unnamed protein product [Amoebophrya sp. A120]|eukprot:GSA120T00017415001.1